MTLRRWRKKLADSEAQVRAAECLLACAQEQQRHAEEEIAPRVDAVASSLQRLRRDNHFGPMIDSILRGMPQ